VTYRLTPHSSDDDDRAYRERDEVDAAKAKDPIISFAAYLKEVGVLTDEKEKEINDKIAKEVNDATEYAENAPYADAESAMKHVYAE
jgi:2-oxoisovalerate dehydrogenase E1 component alpha subunit